MYGGNMKKFLLIVLFLNLFITFSFSKSMPPKPEKKIYSESERRKYHEDLLICNVKAYKLNPDFKTREKIKIPNSAIIFDSKNNAYVMTIKNDSEHDRIEFRLINLIEKKEKWSLVKSEENFPMIFLLEIPKALNLAEVRITQIIEEEDLT